MNIDTQLNLLPIVVIDRIEVLQEGVAHQEAAVFWVVLVFARSDVDDAGRYVLICFFDVVQVVLEVCLAVELEDALVENVLDWVHFVVDFVTFGVVEVAHFYFIAVGSSSADHVDGVVIFHFRRYFVDEFIKNLLWQNH